MSLTRALWGGKARHIRVHIEGGIHCVLWCSYNHGPWGTASKTVFRGGLRGCAWQGRHRHGSAQAGRAALLRELC